MSFLRASVTSMLFASVLSTAAIASDTRFDCEMLEDETQVSMSFTIANITDAKTITGVQIGDDEYGAQTPILFRYKKAGGSRWQTPKNPYNFIRAAALNGGDASDFYLGKDNAGRKILGRGVSDSCVTGELVLYANTGYRRGWLQSQNNCDPAGKEKSFSKVSCEVR